MKAILFMLFPRWMKLNLEKYDLIFVLALEGSQRN